MTRAADMEVRPGVVARPLDFVVIGAAKSATTTLFHLLRSHPELAMPANKEAPFFSKDDVYLRGWDAYRDDVFAAAAPGARWGKVTPRYLGDLHVPARMAAAMPDTRLVAILRNPIDRAFSKYRLLRRTGGETRSFAALVADQLRAEHVDRARTEVLPLRETVVARGEYARLLDTYLAWFPADQVQVHYTDELEADAGAVVGAVLTHIGAEDDAWRPERLDRRAYEGGDEARFVTSASRVSRNRMLRRMWNVLPADRRRRLSLWFRFEANVRRPADDARPEFGVDTRAALADHYRDDVARLATLVGRPPPWPELAPP